MIDKVQSLLRSIDQGKPLSPDVAVWLKQGIERKIKVGYSLDSTLGLSSLYYQFRREKRNRHIKAAWASINDNDLTEWGRSERLAEILRNFKAGRWENIKYDKEPPKNLPDTQRHLFWALKAGIKMPHSAKGLHDIVKKESA